MTFYIQKGQRTISLWHHNVLQNPFLAIVQHHDIGWEWLMLCWLYRCVAGLSLRWSLLYSAVEPVPSSCCWNCTFEWYRWLPSTAWVWMYSKSHLLPIALSDEVLERKSFHTSASWCDNTESGWCYRQEYLVNVNRFLLYCLLMLSELSTFLIFLPIQNTDSRLVWQDRIYCLKALLWEL